MTSTWWNGFYDDDIADALMGSDDATADGFAALIVKTTEVAPGDFLFDQCCGRGDVSLALARLGMRTVGVEQAEPYVQRAKKRAVAAAHFCLFLHDDAALFTAPEPCDASFNWRSSFGYSLDDAENIRMIKRAYESLKPGAVHMLDYLFPAYNMRTYDRDAVREYEVGTPESPVRIMRHAQFDFAAGATLTKWIIRKDGKTHVCDTVTKLYAPHEIKAMCEHVGFRDVHFLGGYDGQKLNIDSPRSIAVMRKPSR